MKFDFRLLDVSLELHALDDHYELIEKQLAHLSHVEQKTLAEYCQKEGLTPDDPEWDLARQECDYKIDFLLPRFFYGSFIISLYAVYETSVTEIARLLMKSKKCEIDINEIRGSFLQRAEKYYNNILNFELCSDVNTWKRIKELSTLRHSLAHANGRIDMMKDDVKKGIRELVKKNVGVSTHYNYVIVDVSYAKETLNIVSSSLGCLVDSYKNYTECS